MINSVTNIFKMLFIKNRANYNTLSKFLKGKNIFETYGNVKYKDNVDKLIKRAKCSSIFIKNEKRQLRNEMLEPIINRLRTSVYTRADKELRKTTVAQAKAQIQRIHASWKSADGKN